MKFPIKFSLIISVILFFFILQTQASQSPPENRIFSDISLQNMILDNNKYVQTTKNGEKVTFTSIPELQEYADNLFQRYDVPAGAAVVLNSRTGRVLAMSQYLGKNYAATDENVALDASAPAASVFKIVTTSALLETTPVKLDTSVCYHGGGNRLLMENLLDNKKLDTACRNVRNAFGFSTNSVYAKLSDRHLSQRTIEQYAKRFGFGTKIPFDVSVPTSDVNIPQDRLEKARVSAGFWNSNLSPLHGAMIAQSIAQNGAMLKPYIIDNIEDEEGNIIYKGSPQFIGRTVEQQTAKELIEAMKVTVSRGTARSGFRDDRGNQYLPNIEVAGKTGTLHGQKPFRAYSWFVGLAPADNPEVAIAVLIVNEPKWRIRSSFAAAQILKKYFEDISKN